MNTKITAKDFFLHLGAIATFYTSVVALITLLFTVINFAYPKINAFQYYYPSIGFQVAMLIVAFPLFLLLSWLLQKSYMSDPMLRDAPIRRALGYLTLFVAGAVVAGDLVAVIYLFLDGQELTTAFLLKVLALLVIVGGVFLYYLREIRNVIGTRERNVWRGVSVLVILVSIVVGFMVIGSPASQRNKRQDSQRVVDLQNIQWQLVNYWQQKSTLPDNLSSLSDSISGWQAPTDPEGRAYTYKKTGAMSFELCATFDEGSKGSMNSIQALSYPIGKMGENWEHTVGVQCFPRTIDPDMYPPYTKRLPM